MLALSGPQLAALRKSRRARHLPQGQQATPPQKHVGVGRILQEQVESIEGCVHHAMRAGNCRLLQLLRGQGPLDTVAQPLEGLSKAFCCRRQGGALRAKGVAEQHAAGLCLLFQLAAQHRVKRLLQRRN